MKIHFLKQSAFTLIELLIVVLIIAILAAIAVPNFLEFQTRAKISRVMSDHRTVATAMEAYVVDNNVYPPDEKEFNNASIIPGPWNAGPREYQRRLTYIQLTTPVAYVTTFEAFFDQFQEPNPIAGTTDGQNVYILRNIDGTLNAEPSDNEFIQAKELGYTWVIKSNGPARVAGDDLVWPLIDATHPVTKVYDPTNGTVSNGLILRTNKGVFQGLPGS